VPALGLSAKPGHQVECSVPRVWRLAVNAEGLAAPRDPTPRSNPGPCSHASNHAAPQGQLHSRQTKANHVVPSPLLASPHMFSPWCNPGNTGCAGTRSSRAAPSLLPDQPLAHLACWPQLGVLVEPLLIVCRGHGMDSKFGRLTCSCIAMRTSSHNEHLV